MNVSYAKTKTDKRGKGIWLMAVLRKIGSALTFNADGIFKSRDWPHLWSK